MPANKVRRVRIGDRALGHAASAGGGESSTCTWLKPSPRTI